MKALLSDLAQAIAITAIVASIAVIAIGFAPLSY